MTLDEKLVLKAYLKVALKFIGLYLAWFALAWLPVPIFVFLKSQHPQYLDLAGFSYLGYIALWLFAGTPLWYTKITRGSRTMQSSRKDSLSKRELEDKLLQLNQEQDYFRIKKLDDRLVAEWNLLRPTLRDVLLRSRLSQNYKMIIGFDEKSRTAGSVDRVSAGYKGFSLRNFSFQFSQGLIIEFETEPILELLNVLKKGTYDPKTIRLNTLAVKVPVIKTILESGWNYRIRLF